MEPNRFAPSKGSESRDGERLSLLVSAGDIFHQSLDVAETLDNVARLAVESFAELCLFDLIDERSERLFVTAAAHRDPQKEEALGSVSNILYVEEFGVHPVVQVTRTGEPFFLPHIDEQVLMAHAASRQHEQWMRNFNYRSKIVVPVVAQNHIFGALTFVRTPDSIEFDAADLMFASELGRRAGLAVANAKQFRREQHVAETLQRAFLPSSFPVRNGLQFNAFYRPGSTEADIGGDWYDAFENEHGDVVITIGDITGKGIEAARLMVLMRQAMRVAALEARDPRRIAALCNRLLLSESKERLASAFIGVYNEGTRTLTYVSAGHVPPLLRLPSRKVVQLEAPSAPLGAFADVDFELHRRKIADGSMLVLFTDGIIEATRDIFHGQEQMERIVSSDAVSHTANPAQFIERVAGQGALRDDIAILVAAFGAAEMRWQFEAADARAAYTMRDQFLTALITLCAPDDDELANCNLIFAELIGNAVRHAPGGLSVSLELHAENAILHVIDSGPGFELKPSLPRDIWAESGRGLFLISKIARDVQAEQLAGGGSHVFVTLPVSCVLRGGDPQAA